MALPSCVVHGRDLGGRLLQNVNSEQVEAGISLCQIALAHAAQQCCLGVGVRRHNAARSMAQEIQTL